MRYCILCGVPITRRLHEPWLKEFRAVWIEDDNWDDVKLSGVGLCDEYDDVVAGTVPTDPSKRYDDGLDPDSMIEVALVTFNVKDLVFPETARYEPEPFWGCGIHSSCWSLFTTGFTPNLRHLFAACLSMPIGKDSILDWGHDYGGAAALSRVNDIPTLGSRFENLASMPQGLRSDPFDIPSLAKAIKLSARLQDDAFQSSLDPNSLNLEGDGFSRLSPELLQLIATLLPTRDVRSLRLASPVFATLSLSEKFWASRFQQGHEFDDIPEVFLEPPESWRALYLSLEIWALDNPNMANRRRVWKLAKCLQTTLHQMEGVPCDGSPLKTWFEPTMPSEGEGGVGWLRAARCINNPRQNFNRGSRALRARALRFSQALEVQSMAVSLVTTGGGLFVSGLQFVDSNGQSHALGYLHYDQSVLIRVPAAGRIQGWELALDISGIRAIAVISEDGTRSPWVGEPANFPRWHLAEIEGISAVKAEFDGLKLVSLSRNSCGPSGKNQWRNSCLWSPDIPSTEPMIFNGSEGDQPPGNFVLPLTTLLFGGSDGQNLPKLAEVAIWTFDLAHVAGIEFLYGDGSQNQVLGHIGPFGDDHPAATRFDISEGRRISFSIDGPSSEELKSVEIQKNNGYVVGLKIHTNFGRKVTSPQHPLQIGEKWTVVHPAGSKVVGLFATCGHFLLDLGLISRDR